MRDQFIKQHPKAKLYFGNKIDSTKTPEHEAIMNLRGWQDFLSRFYISPNVPKEVTSEEGADLWTRMKQCYDDLMKPDWDLGKIPEDAVSGLNINVDADHRFSMMSI